MTATLSDKRERNRQFLKGREGWEETGKACPGCSKGALWSYKGDALACDNACDIKVSRD